MFAVVMISMLMIFGSGIYLIYHFIRKIKNRDRLLPKKKFYSILIGSVIAFIVSVSFLDTDDISAYNEIKKLNSELTDNNLVLSAQVDDANKNNDELKEEIKQLKESHTTEIEEIQNEHKEEIASLTEKHKTDIKKLEDENEKLVTEKESLETQKTDLESKKASLEGKVKELEGNLAQAQAKKETTSKPDDSGSATKSSGTTNNTNSTTNSSNNNSTSTASASANESCDIKGSKTGIYHTPGSTYYNKTTNVVQWFCSTTEAEAAGYRAPKR